MERGADGVVAHYGRDDLMARIRTALRASGHDPDAPTVAMLSELDHLHGGGLAATRVQAELAGLVAGSRVLDAGCGIGGPSRYLAESLGCTVEGIDLTDDYVAVARELNRLVGLDDRVRVAVASVTELPFGDSSFDAVWSQNVTMNVGDKARMFAETFRVVKPGGIFTFSHLARGPAGEPIYPLPWARGPAESFLATPGEILHALAETGFVDVADRADEMRIGPTLGPQPGTIGAVPAMGDDMPVRNANAARSLEEGRLVRMLVVARRPESP